jgi:hypothetical protein
MNRFMVLAATVALAATSVPIQTQTADAGFLRRVLTGGHRHHRVFHHRHHHRRILVAPIVAAPVIAAPAMAASSMRAPGRPASAPSNADGAGRAFDPASMAWTDGKNQCWSGKQPWSFRSGSWFYGGNRWYPANGTWLTDAPEPPAPIDCQSVAAFAPSKATTTTATTGVARVEKSQRDDSAENSARCSKYSASIGQMITVPCEG